MPLVNFISAQMKSPKKKYVRTRYGALSGGIETVIGVLPIGKKGKRGGRTEIQSYRFDVRKGWTMKRVRAWVKRKKLKPRLIEDVQKGKAAEKKRKLSRKRVAKPKKLGEQQIRALLEKHLAR